MTEGCTSRSIAAAVVIGSLNISSHFENARLLVNRTLPRSYRSASKVNRTSIDRKSTRLNSSHLGISYAVFCLKKKKPEDHTTPGRRGQTERKARRLNASNA